MKIGCHISISDGIENSCMKASELECESFQIFTQNQRQWVSKLYNEAEIDLFRAKRRDFGYENSKIISHASYLINLCAVDSEKLQKSRNAFRDELLRSDTLGIDGVVIHPGSHGGVGESRGIETIATSINEILMSYNPKVQILLETIAGQGTGVGYNFEQLYDIFNRIEKKQHIGICLDTCHIFAAGYSIRNRKEWDLVLEKIESSIGIRKIGAIHLNDSKFECGSKKDRHASIGNGFIGRRGFESLINIEEFKDIPAILEVPGGDTVFQDNIQLLKSFRI